MYELNRVFNDSYVIESLSNVGLVRISETDVCLIDSGSDKSAGRKIRQILDGNGWRLTAIYNTHSHADHTGGNRYLADQTGCRIYAPDIESAFVRHPLLEPTVLYGGCPPEELCHKFLMAKESGAQILTADVLPEGWEMIDLPGHFFDMKGYRTKDDVVYLADSLCGEETLEKYRICFLFDVGAYLATLEKVKTMEARMFVPSHAPVTENIAGLAQKNIDSVYGVADFIENLCAEPAGIDAILKRVFETFDLRMTFEQHALLGSTVRSYLSWLSAQGRVEGIIEDNTLLWKKK